MAKRVSLAILASLCACLHAETARLSIAAGDVRQIILHEAKPGSRFQLMDGTELLGTLLTDSLGDARRTLPPLSFGSHSLRVVEWGSGRNAAAAIAVRGQGKETSRFTQSFSYPTGLPAAVIASVDIDSSGLADLVMAGGNDIQLMRNQGGSFRPGPRLTAASGITAMASQDFDGDGRKDLAIGSSDGHVSIVLNRGDDGFSRMPDLTSGSRVAAVAGGDFNGDGIPDLATADPDDNRIWVLLGKGDGTFRAARPIPAGYAPRALVVADFNSDGIADLATANFSGNDVSILLGDGRGGFQNAVSVPSGNGPVSLAAADFDDDGAPDLAVFNQFDGTVVVLMNSLSSGNWRQAARIPAAALVGIGDLNGDGRADLVTQSGSDLEVLTGLGDGNFEYGYAALSGLTAGSPAAAMVTGDFNGDGRLDIGIADANGTLTVFAGSAAATGSPAHVNLVRDGRLRLEPLSVNLLAASSTTLSASASSSLYLQNLTLTATVSPVSATGSVTFEDGGMVLGSRPVVNGQAVLTTNLLGAGMRSLRAYYSGSPLYSPSNSDIITQLVSTLPANGMQAAVNYAANNAPFAIAVGDFNGDGRPDLAVANKGSDDVSVLIGNGNGTFRTAVNYETDSYPIAVAVGDLNGDGRLDIVVSSAGSVFPYVNQGTIDVLLGNGDGTFQAALSYTVGNGSGPIALGDFNGDGKLDVAVGGRSRLSVLVGNGNGTFQPAVVSPGGFIYALATGDFNGDGRADLFTSTVTSKGVYVVSLLLGNGNGTFQPAVNYGTGASPGPLVVGDFNGDGKADLAATHSTDNNVSILLGNGDGSFRVGKSFFAGNGPAAVVCGDFNGDGNSDLAFANSGGSTVSLIMGSGNGTFGSATTRTVFLAPTSLAAGDFNGDGRADLAVTNSNADPLSGILFGGSVSVLLGMPSVPPTVYIDSLAPDSTVFGTVTVSGWAIDNATSVGTRIGSVQIRVDGVLVGIATYGTPRSDVCSVFPGRPGCPNVGFTYQLNAASLGSGPRVITAVATDTDATPDAGSFSVRVNVSGPPAPSVYIDSLLSGATVSGKVTVSGWAIDSATAVGTRIGSVQVKVDGILVGTATYGSPRQDVCAVFPGRPGCPNVGFTYALNTAGLSAGAHTVTVVATDTDVIPDSGSFSVTVNVVALPPPMIYIDSVPSGGTVSGVTTISGWAINGTTAIDNVQVKVDGTVVGTASYGTPRLDVCVVYPGRPGCPNVGFTYSLNTAALSTGAHTVTVVATDTNGTPGSFSLAVKK